MGYLFWAAVVAAIAAAAFLVYKFVLAPKDKPAGGADKQPPLTSQRPQFSTAPPTQAKP